MKRYASIGCIILLSAYGLKENLFTQPKGWPDTVYDFKNNPLTEARILLGRALFYDPILSADNSISCASCHSSYTAFTHVDHALSHGIHDSIGTRNSPALMNLAWQNAFMWDGAINHLDKQAMAPISHPSEMGNSMQTVIDSLNAHLLYKRLFYKAYGDSTASLERTLKSMSQFMLTLVSANSKYDRVKNGKETFTVQEEKGYQLFQKHCNSCHAEPLFSSYTFENNGLPPDLKLNDNGRQKLTGKTEDAYKFKVPSLRNVEYSFPYMHDGRFGSLREVLNHYSNGIHKSETLSKQLHDFKPLTADEKTELISFLLTLSDKEFVFNPQFAYPMEVFFSKTKEPK